jgi:hypothetical protein
VAISGALRKPLGAGKKIAIVQSAVTGTGAIATGLQTVDTGAVQLTVQNSATTVPTGGSAAAVTSMTGASANTVVIDQQAAANVVAGGAKNVGLLAVGS